WAASFCGWRGPGFPRRWVDGDWLPPPAADVGAAARGTRPHAGGRWVTLQLLAGLALAALCGISVASLYLAIPRRPTAEEWILHRRAVSGAEGPAIRSSRLGEVWRRPSLSLQRYRVLSEAVSRDLLLLRLAGHQA